MMWFRLFESSPLVCTQPRAVLHPAHSSLFKHFPNASLLHVIFPPRRPGGPPAAIECSALPCVVARASGTEFLILVH